VLVTSKDTWFRLSDVCVAPDGSVMLADWYDPGVGGHGMGDWTRGRIYRVTPKGHKGYTVPQVALNTPEALITNLASPCLATRHIAMATLRGMKPAEAFQVLSPGESAKLPDVLKARMFWQLYCAGKGIDPRQWPEKVDEFLRSIPPTG